MVDMRFKGDCIFISLCLLLIGGGGAGIVLLSVF